MTIYCFKTYCTILLGHIWQRANQVSNVFECSWMYLKCLNVRECVRSSEKFLWWCSSCVKGNLRWHLATALHHNHPIQLIISKFINMCAHTFFEKKLCLGPAFATHSSRKSFFGTFEYEKNQTLPAKNRCMPKMVISSCSSSHISIRGMHPSPIRPTIMRRSPWSHIPAALLPHNNIFRHTCYCLSSGKQLRGRAHIT